MSARNTQGLEDLLLATRDLRNTAYALRSTVDLLGDAAYALDDTGSATVGPVETMAERLEKIVRDIESLANDATAHRQVLKGAAS